MIIKSFLLIIVFMVLPMISLAKEPIRTIEGSPLGIPTRSTN